MVSPIYHEFQIGEKVKATIKKNLNFSVQAKGQSEKKKKRIQFCILHITLSIFRHQLGN